MVNLHFYFLPLPFSQFPFFPIPIPNFITNSNFHGISTGLLLFLLIPIPEQLFNRCGINNFGLSKIQSVHCLSLSLELITAARITLYCTTCQHNWTSQTKENMSSGTQLWLTVVFYAEKDCHRKQSPMEIYSHGNKGYSHFHTGGFPFLPILISNFVINFHFYGIPIRFPFLLGIPFPLLFFRL